MVSAFEMRCKNKTAKHTKEKLLRLEEFFYEFSCFSSAGVLRLGGAVFRLHANPLDAEAIDVVFEGKGGAP